MKISSRLRGCAAVVMGLIITAAFGLFILIFGLPCRLCTAMVEDIWGANPFRNPFDIMAKYWALTVHRICMRNFLQISVEIEGTVNPLQPGEVVVCIANHPSTLTVSSFFWFVTQRLAPRFLVVAKRQHLTNIAFAPFVGWPLWTIASGIFIDRSKPGAAFSVIRTALDKIGQAGALIIIFPDMRRPTPERITADHRKFRTEVHGLEYWLTHTLLPRSGGLETIVTQLYTMGRPLRVVNITCALSAADNNVREAPQARGAVFHLEVETYRRIPRDQSALQIWLREEWKLKNARIRRWKSSY